MKRLDLIAPRSVVISFRERQHRGICASSYTDRDPSIYELTSSVYRTSIWHLVLLISQVLFRL